MSHHFLNFKLWQQNQSKQRNHPARHEKTPNEKTSKRQSRIMQAVAEF